MYKGETVMSAQFVSSDSLWIATFLVGRVFIWLSIGMFNEIQIKVNEFKIFNQYLCNRKTNYNNKPNYTSRCRNGVLGQYFDNKVSDCEKITENGYNPRDCRTEIAKCR